MDYEKIELETAMRSPNLYRTTPYQFALTAEPRQVVVTCGRIVSGKPVVVPRFVPLFQPLHLEPLAPPVAVETDAGQPTF